MIVKESSIKIKQIEEQDDKTIGEAEMEFELFDESKINIKLTVTTESGRRLLLDRRELTELILSSALDDYYTKLIEVISCFE